MPNTTSRLRAVEVQLETIIQARTALAGIPVDRGHPGQLLQAEHIWIGTISFEDESRTLDGPAQNTRRQIVTAELTVRVREHGNDSATLRDRTYVLANEVEEALRDPANENLAGEVDFYMGVEGALDNFLDEDGRVAAMALNARWRARKG